jgi:hypothetical protein
MTRNALGTCFLILALAAGPALATSSDLWIHVRVEEGDGTVHVNLPLASVQKLLPMIPADRWESPKVVFEDREITVRDLREAWEELRNSPDMAFVTVQEPDEHVRIYKEADYLRVEVDEQRKHAERVEVTIPIAVVDALLAGEGDSIDLHAALTALADHGEGQLVTVDSDGERVRVWIDADSEGR